MLPAVANQIAVVSYFPLEQRHTENVSLRAATLLLAAVLLITSCGGGVTRTVSKLEPVLAQEADDINRLARSRWAPPEVQSQVNPGVIRPHTVTDAATTLASPLDDVPTEDAWVIARGACEGVDLLEATQSWEAARNYVRGKSPSMAYVVQAEELLKNLAKAEDSGDIVWVLGKAALCEAADRKA